MIIPTVLSNTAVKSGIALPAVEKVIKLFDEGATVPFIARYRKEVTGGLDEVMLRDIRDSYTYCRELEERRQTILASIRKQEKLTPELEQRILATTEKQQLEDLYLPFKPKRKTRDSAARDLGLEPLAQAITGQAPYTEIMSQIIAANPALDEEKCIGGALDIIAADIADNAAVVAAVRENARKGCEIQSTVKKEFAEQRTKFMDYYDSRRRLVGIPAHALLAMRRGEKAGILTLHFELPDAENVAIVSKLVVPAGHTYTKLMHQAVEDAYRRLIKTRTEVDLRLSSKQQADDESIAVFSENLKNLLLAPYGGETWLIAADPGFRTGCKLTLIDPTGKPLCFKTVYPTEPKRQTAEAEQVLCGLLNDYPVEFICIGNGTASRELFDFVADCLQKNGFSSVRPVFVNEAGASVYSASDISRAEFPDLDVTFRGAVSIGRRFQDPLAELVKIDPQSVGVGQYQHDVDQKKLHTALHDVLEHCVNFVGVNLNTASAPLLKQVAGMSASLAEAVLRYREKNGKFTARQDLLNVPGLGAKTFEQCAGFLRIPGAENPLDNSAVHPESYALVEKMAAALGLSSGELIGNKEAVDKLSKNRRLADESGTFTLQDVLQELLKPGRDPRMQFVGAKLDANITSIDDLSPGLVLEGTVTNITKFGAFVDIGVHRDGLVHISEMTDRFVDDPTTVCRVNQIVTVRVTEIDKERGRIALSMRQEAKKTPAAPSSKGAKPYQPAHSGPNQNPTKQTVHSFADLVKETGSRPRPHKR